MTDSKNPRLGYLSKEQRRQHVMRLVATLEALDDETNPAAGEPSAHLKEAKALEACWHVNMLVRATAGWAIDHIAGRSMQANWFASGDGLSGRLAPPTSTSGDSHSFEQLGRDDHYGEKLVSDEVARLAMRNFVLANPGALPGIFQVYLLDAIEALWFGETLPVFQATADDRKVGLREFHLHFEALLFVAYRVGRGLKKFKAQQAVAESYCVSPDTLRTWEKRLRQEFDPCQISGQITAAERAGEASAKGKEGADVARFRFGDEALARAAERYRLVRVATSI